jgi:Flp pilus assembly protein TadD
MCALLAIDLGLGAADASRVHRANDLGAAGHYAAAAAEAAAVHRAPADAAALLVRARALTADGDGAAARDAWRRVVRRTPNDWRIHEERAAALASLGAPGAVVAAAHRRARELNPWLTR